MCEKDETNARTHASDMYGLVYQKDSHAPPTHQSYVSACLPVYLSACLPVYRSLRAFTLGRARGPRRDREEGEGAESDGRGEVVGHQGVGLI